MYCRPYKKTFIIIKKCDIMSNVKDCNMTYDEAYEKAIKDKMTSMQLDSNSIQIANVIETCTTFHVYLKLDI